MKFKGQMLPYYTKWILAPVLTGTGDRKTYSIHEGKITTATKFVVRTLSIYTYLVRILKISVELFCP
jgi:hypothetical protein